MKIDEKSIGSRLRTVAIPALRSILLLSSVPRALAFSDGQAAGLVLGEPNLTAFNPQHTAAGLATPYGLAFDSSGNLWVSDQSSNRVLEYKAPFSNGEAASVVICQPNMTGNATTPVFSPTSTGLNHPDDMAFDSSGNLWVADSGEGRVLEYGSLVSAVSSTSKATTTPATTSASTSTTTTISTSSSSSVSTAASSSTTSTSSSKSGGGVPEFPFSLAIATAFTVLLAAAYLLVRHRATGASAHLVGNNR